MKKLTVDYIAKQYPEGVPCRNWTDCRCSYIFYPIKILGGHNQLKVKRTYMCKECSLSKYNKEPCIGWTSNDLLNCFTPTSCSPIITNFEEVT